MLPDNVDAAFWWNWAVQAGVAAGTIGAVVVALFAEGLRSKFFPPVLSVSLGDPAGISTPVDLSHVANGQVKSRREEARYYYLAVKNLRRWTPASQAHVLLLAVEELGPAGSYVPRWAGEVPLHWSPQTYTPPQITVGPTKNADLCSVIRGKGLQLQLLVVPHALKTSYDTACNLRLTLQCHSNEIDSDILKVRIDWDGEWHSGAEEMKGHLQLSVEKGPVSHGSALAPAQRVPAGAKHQSASPYMPGQSREGRGLRRLSNLLTERLVGSV